MLVEWALLIVLVVVIWVADAVTCRWGGLGDILIAWILAGILIAIGMGVYGRSKVEKVKEGGLLDRYQIDEEL